MAGVQGWRPTPAARRAGNMHRVKSLTQKRAEFDFTGGVVDHAPDGFDHMPGGFDSQ